MYCDCFHLSLRIIYFVCFNMVLRFKSGVFYTYNNSSEEKIMKLVGHVEVTKGYEHWKKIFLSHESKRKEYGIETVFTGTQADNHSIVHVCLEVQSMDNLQEFMKDPENGKVFIEAGVKIETQIMVPIIE